MRILPSNLREYRKAVSKNPLKSRLQQVKNCLQILTEENDEYFEKNSKLHIILFILVIGFIYFFIFSIISYLNENYIVFIIKVFLTVLTIIIFSMLLFRTVLHIKRISHIITIIFLIFLVSINYYENLDQYSSIWIITFPPVSLSLVGVKRSLFFSGTLYLLLGMLGVLGRIIDANLYYFITLLSVYTAVLMISILYQRTQNTIFKKLKHSKTKLDQAHSEMYRKVQEYEKIIKNVDEGIFIVDADLQFQATHSQMLLDILEITKIPALATFRDVFKDGAFISKITELETFMKSILHQKILNNKQFYLDFYIREHEDFFVEEEQVRLKKLQFFFSAIEQNNGNNHLLCRVKDVTLANAIEEKIHRQEELKDREMKMFFEIINLESDELKLFIENTWAKKESLQEIIENSFIQADTALPKHAETEKLQEHLRKKFVLMLGILHSIKGNAGAIGFYSFSLFIHELEEALGKLQTDYSNFIPIKKKKGLAYTYIDTLEIELQKINTGIKKLTNFNNQYKNFKKTTLQSIVKRVQRYIEIASGKNKLALRLQSKNFDESLLSLNHNLQELVSEVFIQFVKNSIAHGIETPEQRRKHGKALEASIEISSELKFNKNLVLRYRDDGKGLSPQKIRDYARNKLQYSSSDAEKLTEQQLYNLIFHQEFTTKDEVTLDAGRGIGLNFVKTSLRKYNADIQVQNNIGEGLCFIIEIPLIQFLKNSSALHALPVSPCISKSYSTKPALVS